MLINESPIGNGPSKEMRVDSTGHAGCWKGWWMNGTKEGAAGEFCGSVGRQARRGEVGVSKADIHYTGPLAVTQY